MKKYSREIKVFFALLKAGLWEQRVFISSYEPIDFEAIYKIADQQSVVGLISSGIELVQDRKVAKSEALPFLKKVYSLEGRNADMNQFINSLMARMRQAGIYSLLVKGQGIAQCYARPLWRSTGDVDLLMDEDNYRKAKAVLSPLASYIDKEYGDRMHLAMTIDSWTVELHGSLRSKLLGRVNTLIDEAQKDTFNNGHVRVWHNGETDVFLPAVDNDIIFVFTHILQHFFAGGIGLRQICDWCRLLWTFRESIDQKLLKTRLERVRLLSEWRVFASLSVNFLGMPEHAMPFHRKSVALDRRARRLRDLILRTGNFGQNRDMSYMQKYPFLIRKTISLWRATQDAYYRMLIFPVDSMVFYSRYIFSGSKAALRGEG